MKEIEQLYRLYRDDVYRYLLSLTREPHLAEDLLSDTFLKALQGLTSFRGEASVKTWLFAIARNQWLQYLKRKRIHLSLEERTAGYMGAGTEDRVLDRLAAERVLALLEEMEERTRGIVSKRIEGWSFAEIAEEYGISESSARVIDHRAKGRIKEQLRKEGLL